MKNRVRECGEERDGLGGVRGSPEGPWQWWPAMVVEDDEPYVGQVASVT